MTTVPDPNPEDQLRQALEEPRPESWVPEDPDEILVGRFEGLEWGETRYGPSPIAAIRDSDGKRWSVWLFGKVLHNEFRRTQPQVGEWVGIKFLGERTSAEGQRYKTWRVEVLRAGDSEVSWDDLEAPEDLEPGGDWEEAVPPAPPSGDFEYGPDEAPF